MEGYVLSSQDIVSLIDHGSIFSENPIDLKNRIKPASFEPTFGSEAFEITAAFLPEIGKNIEEQIERRLVKKINLRNSYRLEVGKAYVIPLQEGFDLSGEKEIHAKCNPRSRCGRIDFFLRLLVDGVDSYDKIPLNYVGKAYVLAIPHSFPIIAYTGFPGVQLRFMIGNPELSDSEIKKSINGKDSLELFRQNGSKIFSPDVGIKKGLINTVNLTPGSLLGFKAKKFEGTNESWPAIDLKKIGWHDVNLFFIPLTESINGSLILEPDTFYLFQTLQVIKVPDNFATDIVPIDATLGEYRSHYAGFVDPGFNGTLTLEVRVFSRTELRHNQAVCRIVCEKLNKFTNIKYSEINSAHFNQNWPNPGAFFNMNTIKELINQN
ncbi:2'-deoxycytidine 5'-triphosphate deaminase [Candidatus Woesearchaeota archaeon]|nr:2'-deoxycytidine 5'-triphosphate deaminase [Candidatus Woesearchaeota archaeon]